MTRTGSGLLSPPAVDSMKAQVDRGEPLRERQKILLRKALTRIQFEEGLKEDDKKRVARPPLVARAEVIAQMLA
jgi:hypothetical protein